MSPISPILLPFQIVDLADMTVALSLQGGVKLAIAVDNVIKDAGASFEAHRDKILEAAKEIEFMSKDSTGKVDPDKIEASAQKIKNNINIEHKEAIRKRSKKDIRALIERYVKQGGDGSKLEAEKGMAAVAWAEAVLADLKLRALQDKKARDAYRKESLIQVKGALCNDEIGNQV